MDIGFWHQKWKKNQIAFHANEVNPLLVKHESILKLKETNRVFVPLCGKTLDIMWFLSKGYHVVGVELVEKAIQQLFEELKEKPEISEVGSLKRFYLPNLEIFVGDIFNVSSVELGKVEAVYDRAAFVALPKDMRSNYVFHVAGITKHAPKLLITYEYNQELMDGPPFSFSKKDIYSYYEQVYKIEHLDTQDVIGGLKNHPAKEHVWLLRSYT